MSDTLQTPAAAPGAAPAHATAPLATTTAFVPATAPATAAATEHAHADAKKDADAAAAAKTETTKLSAKAAEDHAKADAETDPAKKAEAVKVANESAKLADDSRAKEAEADRKAKGDAVETSVVDAKVMAPVDPNMPAGHHLAQKFGNDPANPKHDDTLDPQSWYVRMSHQSPDHPFLMYCDVHPEMVGDYARAGWNLDDLDQLGARAGASTDRTYEGKSVTIVRDGRAGDTGYDAAKGDQVLVKMDDGSVKAVPRGDLKAREAAVAKA